VNLADSIDDRSISEQLRDLGVEIVQKNKKTITGAKWVEKHAQKKPKPPRVTVGKDYLYFNVVAAKLIKYPMSIGVGTYEGKKVLLLKVDPDGYKVKVQKGKGGVSVANGSLAKYLLLLGIKKGRHELIKINDGWMGVPK
jgi:hypothetical protein